MTTWTYKCDYPYRGKRCLQNNLTRKTSPLQLHNSTQHFHLINIPVSFICIQPADTERTNKEQPDIVNVAKSDDSSEQLTRALLESPLAKMGLHPAYLLGLKPLPWEKEEQRMAEKQRQEEAEKRQASLKELQVGCG